MDQIKWWPKQLPCLGAVMGSCREQFRLFALMREVMNAAVSRNLPLIYACRHFPFPLCFLRLFTSILASFALVLFPFFVSSLITSPLIWPAASRSVVCVPLAVLIRTSNISLSQSREETRNSEAALVPHSESPRCQLWRHWAARIMV